MQKVFDTYAQRKGIQANSLRFLLDGEKIGADQTPKMLELDDQDQIDCMLEQVRSALLVQLKTEEFLCLCDCFVLSPSYLTITLSYIEFFISRSCYQTGGFC